MSSRFPPLAHALFLLRAQAQKQHSKLREVLKRRRRARAAYVLRARARLRAQLPRLTARGVAIVELLPLNRWRESAARRAERILHRMLLSSSSSFRAASKYESTRRRCATGARCQLQLEGSDGERDHHFSTSRYISRARRRDSLVIFKNISKITNRGGQTTPCAALLVV